MFLSLYLSVPVLIASNWFIGKSAGKFWVIRNETANSKLSKFLIAFLGSIATTIVSIILQNILIDMIVSTDEYQRLAIIGGAGMADFAYIILLIVAITAILCFISHFISFLHQINT